ncbi:hypothetical protein BJX96DRAFT_149618 [Aspergillus floccosus]
MWKQVVTVNQVSEYRAPFEVRDYGEVSCGAVCHHGCVWIDDCLIYTTIRLSSSMAVHHRI